MFGLPARIGTVGFEPSPGADSDALAEVAASLAAALKTVAGTAAPGIAEPAERLRPPPVAATADRWFGFDADDAVRVRGWDGWLPERALGRRRLLAAGFACRASPAGPVVHAVGRVAAAQLRAAAWRRAPSAAEAAHAHRRMGGVEVVAGEPAVVK